MKQELIKFLEWVFSTNNLDCHTNEQIIDKYLKINSDTQPESQNSENEKANKNIN